MLSQLDAALALVQRNLVFVVSRLKHQGCSQMKLKLMTRIRTFLERMNRNQPASPALFYGTL